MIVLCGAKISQTTTTTNTTAARTLMMTNNFLSLIVWQNKEMTDILPEKIILVYNTGYI